MNTTSKSNLGKLYLGGCGAQLGMLLSFVVLGATVLACSACLVLSALSAVVAGEMSAASTMVAVSPTPNVQVEALRGEIDALVAQVGALRVIEPAPAPAPAPQPDLPRPLAIAFMGQANLRSGPGITYSRLGALAAGDSLDVVGRNADASWWLVAAPEGLAWVSSEVVKVYGPTDQLPVLTIPALLVLPEAGAAGNPPANAAPPAATPEPFDPVPAPPAGTPTAAAAESRIFVEDTVGWKRLRERIGRVPISESFSPRGDRIAVIDGTNLFLVAGDASSGQLLLADSDTLRPAGDAVWSPDGEYLAFVVHYKAARCRPCRSVALAHLAEGTLSYLTTQDKLNTEAPRWTQDGRLLVNAHPGEPADGITYVFDTGGRGEPAEAVYELSASHDGQKWLPWRPGRVWKAGVTERPDAFYN